MPRNTCRVIISRTSLRWLPARLLARDSCWDLVRAVDHARANPETRANLSARLGTFLLTVAVAALMIIGLALLTRAGRDIVVLTAVISAAFLAAGGTLKGMLDAE